MEKNKSAKEVLTATRVRSACNEIRYWLDREKLRAQVAEEIVDKIKSKALITMMKDLRVWPPNGVTMTVRIPLEELDQIQAEYENEG